MVTESTVGTTSSGLLCGFSDISHVSNNTMWSSY